MLTRKKMAKMASTLRQITLQIENAQARQRTATRQKRAGAGFTAESAERQAKQLLALLNAKKEIEAELEEVAGDLVRRRDDIGEQIKTLRDEFRKNLDPAADKVLDLHGVMLRYSAHERKMPIGYQTAWDRVQSRVAEKLGDEVATAVAQILADMKESLTYSQKIMTQIEVLAVASETGSNRTAGLLSSLVEAFQKLKPMIDKGLAVFRLAKKRITDNTSSVKANLTKLMDMQDEAAEALEV